MDDIDGIVRMGARELRNALGHRVDAAHFHGEPTIITYNGEPRAVLTGYAEWLASRQAEGIEDASGT